MFPTNSGTVIYDRDGDQTIAPINYYNLEIKNEGIKQITTQGLNSINGDFHIFPLSTFEIQGFMFLNGLNILNEGLLKINESFFMQLMTMGYLMCQIKERLILLIIVMLERYI